MPQPHRAAPAHETVAQAAHQAGTQTPAHASSPRSRNQASALQAIDHSPRVRAQSLAAAPARSATAAPVQRMLLVLGGTYAEEENAKRLRNSDAAEFRSASIDALIDGEVLHLLAHSGGTGFGDHSVQSLSELILPQLPLGLAQLAIQLHGCESTGFASALALRLGKLRTDMHFAVQGIPGYSVISKEGKNFSVGNDHGADELWNSIKSSVNSDGSDANLLKLGADAQAIRDRLDAGIARLQRLMQQDLNGHRDEQERINTFPMMEGRDEICAGLQRDLNELIKSDLKKHGAELKRITAWTADERANSELVQVKTLRSTQNALQTLAQQMLQPKAQPQVQRAAQPLASAQPVVAQRPQTLPTLAAPTQPNVQVEPVVPVALHWTPEEQAEFEQMEAALAQINDLMKDFGV